MGRYVSPDAFMNYRRATYAKKKAALLNGVGRRKYLLEAKRYLRMAQTPEHPVGIKDLKNISASSNLTPVLCPICNAHMEPTAAQTASSRRGVVTFECECGLLLDECSEATCVNQEAG
jgi:hypothetical protein